MATVGEKKTHMNAVQNWPTVQNVFLKRARLQWTKAQYTDANWFIVRKTWWQFLEQGYLIRNHLGPGQKGHDHDSNSGPHCLQEFPTWMCLKTKDTPNGHFKNMKFSKVGWVPNAAELELSPLKVTMSHSKTWTTASAVVILLGCEPIPTSFKKLIRFAFLNSNKTKTL